MTYVEDCVRVYVCYSRSSDVDDWWGRGGVQRDAIV